MKLEGASGAYKNKDTLIEKMPKWIEGHINKTKRNPKITIGAHRAKKGSATEKTAKPLSVKEKAAMFENKNKSNGLSAGKHIPGVESIKEGNTKNLRAKLKDLKMR